MFWKYLTFGRITSLTPKALTIFKTDSSHVSLFILCDTPRKHSHDVAKIITPAETTLNINHVASSH
jgi:hypothetical protein